MAGGTMTDAIALSSPSGRMSKRARRAAEKRLHDALFPDGMPAPIGPHESEPDALRRQARDLRELAARGMHPRSYPREATKLEQQAAELERASNDN